MSPTTDRRTAAATCPWVLRARTEGRSARDAALDFARTCATGAVIVNWKGRGLDPAGRDEVVQEVLVRVLRGIDAADKKIESLQDWVKGTVDLVLRERWKQHSRRPQELVASEELPSDEARPADTLLARERRDLVRACLADLPPHYREMLLLRYREGRSNAGIAVALGKTEKAVEQAIPRALQVMRAALERKRMGP